MSETRVKGCETRVFRVVFETHPTEVGAFRLRGEFPDGTVENAHTGPNTVKSFVLPYLRSPDGCVKSQNEPGLLCMRTDRVASISLIDEIEYETSVNLCSTLEDVVVAFFDTDKESFYCANFVDIVIDMQKTSEVNQECHTNVTREFAEHICDAVKQVFDNMYDMPYSLLTKQEPRTDVMIIDPTVHAISMAARTFVSKADAAAAAVKTRACAAMKARADAAMKVHIDAAMKAQADAEAERVANTPVFVRRVANAKNICKLLPVAPVRKAEPVAPVRKAEPVAPVRKAESVRKSNISNGWMKVEKR